ncbi:MAG: cytochrome c biogenesis protein CcsA [Leadbetterella sp.]
MEKLIRQVWWKFLCVALLLYSFWYGLMGNVPRREILNETIRNVYFHVPLWFAMMALMGASVYYSILYLRKSENRLDTYASSFAEIALIFGFLGFLTGALWGKYTWGTALPNDPKILAVEVGMLLYAAYFILRGGIKDPLTKARLSAVYNIFAVAAFIPLVWIIPRVTDSLHPGNGGNPAFGKYDMDNSMRMVFYPAVIAWILLGVWISTIKIRYKHLENQN